MAKQNISVFWHRRDLRLHDNAGLYHALKHETAVQPVFIFDKNILDELKNRQDQRVSFIYEHVLQLDRDYRQYGASLWVFYSTPLEVFKCLAGLYNLTAVYANRDDEPYARERDRAVQGFLHEKGIPFKGYKDHVIFEKNEVVKNDGSPYTVFTPYARKWKEKLQATGIPHYPAEEFLSSLNHDTEKKILFLEDMGFQKTAGNWPKAEPDKHVLRHYEAARDTPALEGTSKVGVHLRFGTLSIRTLVREAMPLSEKYLDELIWREFYQMILFHYPYTVSSAFKPEYDRITWRNNLHEFEAWCKGQTGYPLVDAGMRELNATGYMHNRVRMVTASFLTKHLLIDWRWGEAYFAGRLLDFELASNVGGWQWAAGCGCDAAPYFRVFNPALQAQKFDPDLVYIRKWVPEYGTPEYVQPIVEHTFARTRAIQVYKQALNESG